MKRCVIDTNIYCDAMRGDADAVAILRKPEACLMSAIVIGELLSGFRQGGKEWKNRDELQRFLQKQRVEKVDVTDETADFYAHILANLRQQGTPIPTNDIWIAAVAMEHGATLATQDEHFKYVQGLYVISKI